MSALRARSRSTRNPRNACAFASVRGASAARSQFWLLCCALLGQAVATRATAQDSLPYLLSRPGEYTDVLDAFQPDNPLDVNVSLTFSRATSSATIAREHVNPADKVGGRFLPVAQSEQVQNALGLEIAVGLYQDLMVYGRLPLVLSDTRRLLLPAAARCGDETCLAGKAAIARSLGTDVAADAPGVFDVSAGYRSATRSGVPALDFGVAWGVVNQYRRPYLPTWVVLAELRVGVGKLMQPCTDGQRCDTGINRGTLRLELGSRWSYRMRYIEPYLGLRYSAEFVTAAGDAFAPGGHVPDAIDAAPPHVTDATLGASFIAWEDRGRFQRFAIDLRGSAAYVSSGRDYSVLYDALGSSSDPRLSAATFSGVTTTGSHARLALELAAAVQAARYVRFRIGMLVSYLTSHLLTDAPPCTSAAATCSADGANPLYQPILDLPGQRFRLSSALTFDLLATATGQF